MQGQALCLLTYPQIALPQISKLLAGHLCVCYHFICQLTRIGRLSN